MHHEDPLYPAWLEIREFVQSGLPAALRPFFAYTSGQLADSIVEFLRRRHMIRNFQEEFQGETNPWR